MIFIALFVCIAVAIVIGIIIPKKSTYTKLDRIGFITNIVLSVLYIPLSIYGIFSLFAADSMFMYPESLQKIIDILISVGICLPFVSVASIALSVVFRKIGKRYLSFVIQFIPIIIFLIMLVSFELIYK